MPEADEGYRDRFARVLKEKELYRVDTWDGATSSWSTNGPLSVRTKLIVGALFATWFFAIFVFGLYKIIAG